MNKESFTLILRDYEDALSDRKRFAALLKDIMPGQSMYANLLLNLYDIDIHEEIKNIERIDNAFEYRFRKRLCDEYGVSSENAEWAVSIWCSCYGGDILGKSYVISQSCDNESEDENDVEKLKQYIEAVFSISDGVNKVAASSGIDADFKVIMRHDLVKFCLYLCASDGFVSDEEANFIRYYFDDYASEPSGFTKFIKENNIYSEEFESTVPLSFTILNNLDRATQKRTSACDMLLKLYETVGKILISIDGVTENEIKDYTTYISMLKRFIETGDTGSQSIKKDSFIQKSTSAQRSNKGSEYTFKAGNHYVGEDIPAGRYDIIWISGYDNCFVYGADGYSTLRETFGDSGITEYKNAELERNGKIKVNGDLTVRFISK